MLRIVMNISKCVAIIFGLIMITGCAGDFSQKIKLPSVWGQQAKLKEDGLNPSHSIAPKVEYATFNVRKGVVNFV